MAQMTMDYDPSIQGPIQPGQWIASTLQDQVRYNVPSFGEIQGTLDQVSRDLGKATFFPSYVAPASKPAVRSVSSMSPLLLLGAGLLAFLFLRRK